MHKITLPEFRVLQIAAKIDSLGYKQYGHRVKDIRNTSKAVQKMRESVTNSGLKEGLEKYFDDQEEVINRVRTELRIKLADVKDEEKRERISAKAMETINEALDQFKGRWLELQKLGEANVDIEMTKDVYEKTVELMTKHILKSFENREEQLALADAFNLDDDVDFEEDAE